MNDHQICRKVTCCHTIPMIKLSKIIGRLPQTVHMIQNDIVSVVGVSRKQINKFDRALIEGVRILGC